MNRTECIKRTDELFAARRAAVKQTLAQHEAEIAQNVPEITRIEKEMRAVASSYFARALDKDLTEEEFLAIKTRSLDLQKRRAELLYENGYSLDYLDPVYNCPDCEDEGFVNGVMCKCYKKALSEALLEESHMKKIAKGQTFAKFDLSYYDGEDRDKMEKLLSFAKKYAARFSDKSQNLLLFGAPGCGKTFLSCAIGSEVINKGNYVVYAPVQEMIDAYEAVKFGKENAPDITCYTECDLLVLDDLGTEFQSQLSENVLYNVINARLNLGKPMVVSTNYAPEELSGMYHDRLTSRLVYEFVKLPFCSKDIRHEKETRKAHAGK